MLEQLVELLTYPFILRALVVGILTALCASLVGVSLVLKRFAMIGDGLSHVGFGALSIAMALNLAPLALSTPLVLLAAFFLLKLTENSHLRGDDAIAMVSTGSLAIGIIVLSRAGVNADVSNYLFGSILTVSQEDLYISSAIAVLVLLLYILFYNRVFAVTFDEDFAKATGIKVNAYNTLLALLTALVIVVGMRIMGAMLISSLIIFPALTAMRLTKRFLTVTICAALLSAICFVLGILLSFVYEIPAGASVVVVNLAAFCLLSVFSYVRKLF